MIQAIVDTPKPPYYAVIFTSRKIDEDRGYDEMSARMVELVSLQDGFLGFESAREELGITVSYWRDEKSIQNWKANLKLTLRTISHHQQTRKRYSARRKGFSIV